MIKKKKKSLNFDCRKFPLQPPLGQYGDYAMGF